MAIQFTQWVGVSPGTTTMEMGGLGMCPPGYYGPEAAIAPAPAPAAGTHITSNPYGNEIELSGRGLRGATPFSLAVLGFGLAFAGVLGYMLVKR